MAALFEQDRAHLVGTFPELEEQLVSWVPGQGESPDRLDALVWAITELVLEAETSLEAELERMTPAERDAFFARQAALMERIYQV